MKIDELKQKIGEVILFQEMEERACEKIGIKPTGMFMGYRASDWENDLVGRAKSLSISEKKRTLEKLESILENLLSPDAKAQRELENIAKMLSDMEV